MRLVPAGLIASFVSLGAGCGAPSIDTDAEAPLAPATRARAESPAIFEGEDALLGTPCPSGDPAICTTTAVAYPASLRVGAVTGAATELAQTFTVATESVPTLVSLRLRQLRPLPTGVDGTLAVAVRPVTDGVVSVDPGSALFSGTVATSALTTGLTPVSLARVGSTFALAPGQTYALVLSGSAPTSGSLLVGVASTSTDAYSGGAALRRSVRGATGTAFLPVSAGDFAFAITASDPFPVVRFPATPGTAPTASRALESQKPFVVEYDVARLPSCRGTNWRIDGFLAGPNQLPREFRVPLPGTNRLHVVAPYDTATFWFRNKDDQGCETWDSNFGNNWSLGVTSAFPVLHLKSNFTSATSGPLDAATLYMNYDLSRLIGKCGGAFDLYGRVPSTQSMTVFWSVNGGAPQSASLVGTVAGISSVVGGVSGQLALPVAIENVPTGTSDIAVWANSSIGGCTEWDSNFGNNWHFSAVR